MQPIAELQVQTVLRKVNIGKSFFLPGFYRLNDARDFCNLRFLTVLTARKKVIFALGKLSDIGKAFSVMIVSAAPRHFGIKDRLHHSDDHIDALGIAKLLVHLFFGSASEIVLVFFLKRTGRFSGFPVIKVYDPSCNLLFFISVKMFDFFCCQIPVTSDQFVYTVCHLRPTQKHISDSVLVKPACKSQSFAIVALVLSAAIRTTDAVFIRKKLCSFLLVLVSQEERIDTEFPLRNMVAGTNQMIVYLILRQVVFRRENIFLLRVFHRITAIAADKHFYKLRCVTLASAGFTRQCIHRFLKDGNKRLGSPRLMQCRKEENDLFLIVVLGRLFRELCVSQKIPVDIRHFLCHRLIINSNRA